MKVCEVFNDDLNTHVNLLRRENIQYYLFGRWLGDGIKGGSSLKIARGKNNKHSMEVIANILGVTCKHYECNYTTLFHNCVSINTIFKKYLNDINDNNFSEFTDVQMFSIIAGFIDSDGSIDYHSPNAKGKMGREKIKIVLYNNNLNILNFFKRFLLKKGIIAILKESYHCTTNMKVVDNCWRLNINETLSIYYLGHKIKGYMLPSKKLERVLKWLSIFDIYHQNQKLNVTEVFTSIEGEGRDSGKVKTFIRVKGCPFKCSFCDSSFSQGSKSSANYNALSLSNIIKNVIATGHTKEIEFTGGSPDWFPQRIGYLLIYFKTHYNSRITMQVSGGISTVKSYKLFTLSDINSYDYKDIRENIPFIVDDYLIREQDEIKFLIKDEESYKFVRDTINKLSSRLKCKFVITTITDNTLIDVSQKHLIEYKRLVKRVLDDDNFPKKNIILFPRLHILVWGNKRGV